MPLSIISGKKNLASIPLNALEDEYRIIACLPLK
jgi:hypothetical protein